MEILKIFRHVPYYHHILKYLGVLYDMVKILYLGLQYLDITSEDCLRRKSACPCAHEDISKYKVQTLQEVNEEIKWINTLQIKRDHYMPT